MKVKKGPRPCVMCLGCGKKHGSQLGALKLVPVCDACKKPEDQHNS